MAESREKESGKTLITMDLIETLKDLKSTRIHSHFTFYLFTSPSAAAHTVSVRKDH